VDGPASGQHPRFRSLTATAPLDAPTVVLGFIEVHGSNVIDGRAARDVWQVGAGRGQKMAAINLWTTGKLVAHVVFVQ
jgi:hypothetical protein